MWAKILLVSLASCAHGSPVEFLNGRLITHTAAVPSLTQVRLVPATAAPLVAAPIAVRTNPRDEEGYDNNPQYNFGYSIADTLTGDSKTREESRDGDVVRGSYSVADPDGRIRTVTYTADAVHGFQAKVTYDGAEGPVAIPFNAPAPATTAVASAPVAVATTDVDDTVIAARAPVATTSSINNIISRQSAATQFIPLRTVAAAPTAVHAVHHAQPQFIRQFSPAVHTIRTAAPVHAVHAVHQATPVVTAVRQAAPVVTAVRQTVPEAVHAVHAVHNHNAAPVTVIRQNGVPQSLDSLFANSGLDLSQFRFVSPVSIIN